MGFMEGMLVNKGYTITVQRTVPVTSHWMRQRFSRSQDANVRNSMFWGYVLSSSSLVSGDICVEGELSFLVQSTSPHESGELEWFGLQCNADVELQRETKTPDGRGDYTITWPTIGSSKGWVQAVTAALRSTDPGLMPNTKFTMQVTKSLGARVLDRLVYGGKNYRIESVDDVGMDGVAKLQLSEDYR